MGALKINMLFEMGTKGFPIDSLRSLVAEKIHCELFTRNKVHLVQHTLSELTNILYLLALVILTLFSLVDTITEGS